MPVSGRFARAETRSDRPLYVKGFIAVLRKRRSVSNGPVAINGSYFGSYKDIASDLPPLKWSSLKYDFRTEDKINGKEEAYG